VLQIHLFPLNCIEQFLTTQHVGINLTMMRSCHVLIAVLSLFSSVLGDYDLFDQLDKITGEFTVEDYSFDFSDYDFSGDAFSGNDFSSLTVQPSFRPTPAPSGVEFSSEYTFGFSIDLGAPTVQPSFRPTLSPSHAPSHVPSLAPSIYSHETKTEFNFDFSVTISNVSWTEFSASEDMRSAAREAVADVSPNISYQDVTILSISNVSTITYRKRNLDEYITSFFATKANDKRTATTRRELAKGTSLDINITIITFRIHGVMERFGRFTTAQYSSFYADLTFLVAAFVANGGFKSSLTKFLQSRGIFRLIDVDTSSLTVVGTSDIDYVISRSPTPGPSQAPMQPEQNKKASPMDRLNLVAIVVLGGGLIILCCLLGVLYYCMCKPKVKRVYVGVGV
jgi:hypothetical protein